MDAATADGLRSIRARAAGLREQTANVKHRDTLRQIVTTANRLLGETPVFGPSAAQQRQAGTERAAEAGSVKDVWTQPADALRVGDRLHNLGE